MRTASEGGTDGKGRYCLNDLHKAAGGEDRHKPGNWAMLDQTKALAAEIETDAGIPASEQYQALTIYKGGNGPQGTYVVRELVYAYAMWISTVLAHSCFNRRMKARLQRSCEAGPMGA